MIRFIIRLVNLLLAQRVVRFILVGGTSAAIEFSLLMLLVNTVSLDYKLANVIAFSLTNILTYLLSRHFVFSPTDRKRGHEVILFIIFLCGGLAINTSVLWAVKEYGGLELKISKVIAILVTIIWNFFTRKYIVFRPSTNEVEAEQS